MADDDSGINARLAVELSADLTQLRRAFEQAGKAADGALLGIEQRGQRTKERLERNIELIRLTQQLDIARASGNNKVVEKLSEEILLRRTVNSLIGQGIKGEEARGMAQAHIAALAAAKRSNDGLTGAAKSVAGSTRVAVFEEGAARVGIYAGALEKLGPAGFAAAAGLAAAGVGLEEAHKAMEWAEDTEKTAKALGVTTTQLQQLDFAAIKAGIGAETLHEGLQKVSQTVGAFTSNVRDARVNPIFEALNKAAGGGFTKADVSQWQGPMDALEHIADGIAKIKDRSQQLTLLKDLKVPDEMVPLLLQGGDAIRNAAKEAKDLGVVMDESTVKKAAELNEKVKEASAIIGNQLRTAFVNLAPAVLVIVNMMAKIATFAADTADNFKHPLSYTPEDMSDHHLQENIAESKRIMAENQAGKDRWEKVPLSQKGFLEGGADWLQSRNFDAAKKTLDLSTPEAARRAKLDKDAVLPPATAIVADKTPKAKKAKEDRDDTGLITGADAALDEAKQGLARAIASQSTDLKAKADAEKSENFADLQKQTDELVRKELDIDKAIAGTKDKKKQAALRAAENTLEEAAVTDGLARAAKDELAERNKVVGLIGQVAALEAQQAQFRQEGFEREASYYRAVAELATTTEDRNRFARQALDANQARERDAAQARVSAAFSALGEATASGKGIPNAHNEASAALAAQAALPTMQGLQNQSFANQHLSPWQSWVKEGDDAAQNVSENLQKYAVKAMDSFNESIAKAIADGKGMKQVFNNIFKEMETSLISYLLKQGEIGILGGGAPGTQGAAGIIGSLLGRGPASAAPRVAGGGGGSPSVVSPASIVSGLSNVASRVMSLGSNTTMNHKISIDLTGANGDDTIRKIAYEAAAAGSTHAISVSGAQMQQAMGQVAFDQSVNQ